MKMVKKLFAIVLCFIFIFTVFYFNSSASDDSDFDYTISGNTIKITKCNIEDKEIIIPDSINGYDVTAIDFLAFARCYNAEKIIIGKNIKSIGNGLFSNCSSLKTIVVSDENNYFSSVDNVLFNKDKTEIICYPAQKDTKLYKMPNSVEIINMNTFSKCAYLENVELSENLKIISMNGFINCENLTSIVMFSKVEKIEQYAMSECSEKLLIYFNGNYEQWKRISVDGNDNEKYNKILVFKDSDVNDTIKLTEEVDLKYSSKIPFEVKVSNNSILKVEGTPKENASGLYEVNAKITPLKSGATTIIAVAENGFVLCNFNYTVEKCTHDFIFLETIEAETCTKDGKQLFTCKYCDYSEEEIVKATGHSMGEWKIKINASKDKNGLEVRECTNYNCDYKEEKVIPKTSSLTEPDNSTGNTSTDFLYGDVDCNGKINATDARKVLRHVAGLETLKGNGLKAADVDGNKKVTATDARKILRHVAGLEKL